MNREQLLERKQELEQRLARIKADLAGGLEADFEEQAVQLENRDVLLEIARVTSEELEQVRTALAHSG